MTPSQRARMHDLLREAVGRGTFPGARGTAGDHGPAHAQPSAAAAPAAGAVAGDQTPAAASSEDREATIAQFRAALESLAGVVHDAATPDDVVRTIVELARPCDAASILAWSEEAIGVPGLHDALRAHGLTICDPHVDHTGPARAPQVDTLAAATIGLTGADYALAQTGSIVLVSGPGRPRLASLLAPIHVAIVRRSTIVDSIATLLASEPRLLERGSNVVCITGPSRTADIEHTLSRGVHGPGEVHAILFAG